MTNDDIFVKSIKRQKLGDDEIPEGHEILRVIFTSGGPAIMFSDHGEALLRSEKGPFMRKVLEDSIKAVLDKITVH